MTKLSLEQFENGVKLYQDENLYKFTSDAIKLAKFCNIKHTDNVLDMCAGSGVVGFYAFSITNFNKLYFNELQPKMCELIKLNINLNNLQDRAFVVEGDLANLSASNFEKPLDVIVCNPPYFKCAGAVKENVEIAMCRHEITVTLEKIVIKAGELIKNKGRFYLIIPADRLFETSHYLSKSKFEIKNMEIYSHKEQATVCLLECVKGARVGVKIKLKPEIN